MKRYALLSVSDKTGIQKFAKFLVDRGYNLLSTGGTFKKLAETPQIAARLTQVSKVTNFPELFGGRVKTLHPLIAGGILHKRNVPSHVEEAKKFDVPSIDVVVCNLYPFERVFSERQDISMKEALELIDIGGVTLLRSAAKNYSDVTVIVDPNDYADSIDKWNQLNRKDLALKAFKHTCAYDAMIGRYLSGGTFDARLYERAAPLKYGCNPHQSSSAAWRSMSKKGSPYKVLNGRPGYINVLDAMGCWGLVDDLSRVCGLPAATSFKHTSPAGAAVGLPFQNEIEREAFFATAPKYDNLSAVACAYVRARNSDPLSSFGDFIGVSECVDEQLAMIIKTEVSDGIIAPAFTEKALQILSAKKSGGYIIIQVDRDLYEYETSKDDSEFREIGGIAVSQNRNTRIVTRDDLKNVTTKELTDAQTRDLLVANCALKYTQSNSVAFASGGQTIGIGAGQQSRVHCVQLAAQKSRNWLLRFHPRVLGMRFKPKTKKQTKINAVFDYLTNDFTEESRAVWESLFEGEPPKALEQREIEDFLAQGLDGKTKDVCLASDAFFPFRDSIDYASRIGTNAVLQPGGSARDKDVVAACETYGMSMAFSGIRMFTH